MVRELLKESAYPLKFGHRAQSSSSFWHNDVRRLCVHMLELEALDSAGSLISIALAARHLPHTCLKVMRNHLRERTLRSGCHLLPANTAHPDNEEKAGNTTQPHQAVCSYASTCFTNGLLSV